VTDLSGEMWDRRFAERAWPTDPDPYLVELAESLPPGRGLDLGAGPGRNSLWLAAKGWDMTLVDLSRVGLDQALAAARAVAATIVPVHADVYDWQPDEADFDLVIVANLHPGPDALASVLARAGAALRIGGHLYAVGHHVGNLGRHGSTDPGRLFTADRLRAALPADLSVDVLDTRPRAFGVGRPDRPNEAVVLAWATKSSAPRGSTGAVGPGGAG
jgi:SAM-dependent methyltransferase